EEVVVEIRIRVQREEKVRRLIKRILEEVKRESNSVEVHVETRKRNGEVEVHVRIRHDDKETIERLVERILREIKKLDKNSEVEVRTTTKR
uniref:De novo designed protein Foldit4 n=1 Tax=synthetic construct TaxID=32630 RepID=UPI00144A4C2B|nr:Chain A, De novo designed protein Foldit4 [synthetic construct]6WI5_B Chain B, De novo designed protein Foldit4 [synthetic construct]